MLQKDITKLVMCPKRTMSVNARAIEPGEEFEVVGQREIAMVGMEPNPSHFYYIAFYGIDPEPQDIIWSDDDQWHEAKTIEEAKEKSGLVEAEDIDLAKMTAGELKTFASTELGEEWMEEHKALKKAELLEAIEAALEEAE